MANVPSGAPAASGGPVTSGVGGLDPEQSCEGDEYVITIAPSTEAGGEEQSLEIVLTKFNEDGSTEELRLEGDLLDAQCLARS